MVESVDEVSPELEPESLRDREVFMHAQVNVGVVRRAQPIELRRAVAEGTLRRLGELPSIGEPLIAN
jgi:hypothetical protein